ncbi:MAG: SET domain-containing protein [bacterium]|nr:SET domain-containing protein [bacterium]
MNEAKQKILNGLKNTYCRLQPSQIQGIGVFAIKDIPKGTDPFPGVPEVAWYKFDMAELTDLDETQRAFLDSFFVIHKDGTVYLSSTGLNGMNISYFLNNSDTPNVKTIDDGENFATMRPIKKGEELTVSYVTFDEEWKGV